MRKKIIYLDYAATTPLDSEVLKEMLPYLKNEYGNPSSIYTLGQKSLAAIDTAREKIANFLGCQVSEIIFTAGATEANNLAIFGVVSASSVQRTGFKPHIISSQIEHHSVLKPCQVLEKRGIEVTYLPVNKEGLINVSDLEKAIRPETILVSIMYTNNEIGTIQPITDIGRLIKRYNEMRGKIRGSTKYEVRRNEGKRSSGLQTSDFRLLFHTDAVQAANYLDCDVNQLGVDLLTLSSHKIYGPKGVGVLFVREGTEIKPLIFGGGHEFGLRSGTENIAAIAGMGATIAKIRNSKSEIRKIERLRNKLIDGILKTIPDTKLNGSQTKRLPNNVNFSFKGIEGESLIIALDQEGIAASTGSACSAKILEPSHVLLALGLSGKEALSSLRLTLGRYTTKEEIERVLKVLPKIVAKLRKIS